MSKTRVGSLRQLANGHWQLRVTWGGKQHAAGTWLTKKAAESARTQIAAEIDAGTYQPGVQLRAGLSKGTTLAELAAEYRSQRIYQGMPIGAKTLREYERYISTVLEPFANQPVKAITEAQVSKWYADTVREIERRRQAGERGAKTTNQLSKVYKHFDTLMRFAEKRGLRKPNTNPCQVEGAARYRPAQPEAPTAEQVRAIVAATENPMHKAAFALLGGGVIRKGELAALQRKDIEVEPEGALRVSIRHSIEWLPGGEWRLKEPKTRDSVRSQYIEPDLAAVFLEWYERQAQIGADAFVFTRANGEPLADTTLRKSWAKGCAAAGGHWRMHSTRSTVLTNWRERGANFADIKAIGGHSSLATAARYQQPADLAKQRELLRGEK